MKGFSICAANQNRDYGCAREKEGLPRQKNGMRQWTDRTKAVIAPDPWRPFSRVWFFLLSAPYSKWNQHFARLSAAQGSACNILLPLRVKIAESSSSILQADPMLIQQKFLEFFERRGLPRRLQYRIPQELLLGLEDRGAGLHLRLDDPLVEHSFFTRLCVFKQ